MLVLNSPEFIASARGVSTTPVSPKGTPPVSPALAAKSPVSVVHANEDGTTFLFVISIFS